MIPQPKNDNRFSFLQS